MAKALSLVSLMALWARIWLMSVSFSCTFIIAFQKDLLSLVCGAGQAGGTGRAVRAGGTGRAVQVGEPVGGWAQGQPARGVQASAWV